MILTLENWRTKETDSFMGREAELMYRALSSTCDIGELTVAAMTVVLKNVDDYFYSCLKCVADQKNHSDGFKKRTDCLWPSMLNVNIVRENGVVEELKFVGEKAWRVREMIDAPTQKQTAWVFKKYANEVFPITMPELFEVAIRRIIIETGMKMIPMEILVGTLRLVTPTFNHHELLLVLAAQKYANCEVPNCDENSEKSIIPALNAAREEMYGKYEDATK